MIREIAYIGRGNSIDLQLTADGAIVNLASVTRMALSDAAGAFAIDSTTKPDCFDWSIGGGVVHLHLGGAGIEPGSYTTFLVVYDGTNPLGIVWDKLGVSFITVT